MSFGIPVRNGLGVGLLASTSLSTRGGSFSPASLFLAGEQGFYYDPSDFSTLFQDSAGTTPVTAVGQTVGLVLDKSRGLGPELVTNGDFSDGTTGWTTNNAGATIAVVSEELELTASAAAMGVLQSVVIAPNMSVVFQVANVRLGTATAGSLRTDVTAGSAVSGITEVTLTSSSKSIRRIITAGPSGVTINIYLRAASAGTLYIDGVSVRELPGNHATQSVLASRPILQQDGSGKYYLLFDGSDDFLVTNTITPGTDKAQVFAGVRKLSDVAAVLAELSVDRNLNNGAFTVTAPAGIAPNQGYGLISKGTSGSPAEAPSGYASPITNVITGICDIANDVATLRVNGAQVVAASTDQGTGNYLAYPLYIGRRGGTSLPFNGRIYSLIVRFGANLTAAQIAQTEAWVNSRTGAY